MKRSAVISLAAVLAVAGCGGTPTSRNANASSVSAPSAAAKLACSADAVSDVATSLGVGVTKPLAPTWADHTYTCRYVFTDGVMVLSVTDHPDASTATAAFTSHQPTGAVSVPGVGQAAYARPDGSAVIRKDASVLTVDVSGLPATFGVPPHPRNIDALTVADAILACWTEDQ
jgi:hypothetical protein